MEMVWVPGAESSHCHQLMPSAQTVVRLLPELAFWSSKVQESWAGMRVPKSQGRLLAESI